MADRTFSIVSATGETITLITDPDSKGDFALMVGVYGIGVPPVAPRFTEGASNGGTFRGKRYGMRTVDLPLFISGTSRATVETNVRKLARVVDETWGLPKLVATYANGDVFELPFVYVGGLEGEGSASSNSRTEYTMSITCPDPFWTARDAVQFGVAKGGPTVGLLPELAKLQIMASVTNGELEINNTGDVATPLNWVITGPVTTAGASLGGRGWTYGAPLLAGEVVRITRTPTGVTVLNGAGANVYAGLGTAPKFFDLPPGVSDIQVTMTATADASNLAAYFRPRRKVVY